MAFARLASAFATTFGAALIASAPVFAADIKEDAVIVDALVSSMVMTEVTTACSTLEPRDARVKRQAKQMMKDISAKGYIAIEIMMLQKPEFLAQLSAKADDYFHARGVDKTDVDAMCAFGNAEIAERTELGKLMKHR